MQKQRIRPHLTITVEKSTYDLWDSLVKKGSAASMGVAADICTNNFLLTHGAARHEHIVNLEGEIKQRVASLMDDLTGTMRERMTEIIESEVELGIKKKVAEEEMPEPEVKRQSQPSFIPSTLVEKRPEDEVLIASVANNMVEYWTELKKPMSMKLSTVRFRLAFRASKWEEFVNQQDNGQKAEFEKKLDQRLFDDAKKRNIPEVDYSMEYLKVKKAAYQIMEEERAKGGFDGKR